jgi:hypothetical protein
VLLVQILAPLIDHRSDTQAAAAAAAAVTNTYS